MSSTGFPKKKDVIVLYQDLRTFPAKYMREILLLFYYFILSLLIFLLVLKSHCFVGISNHNSNPQGETDNSFCFTGVFLYEYGSV